MNLGHISLSDDERRRHLYLAGKTGTGKSTALQHMMLQDLRDERGFALIDPHGDLALSIADSIPRNRTALYLDPLDPTHAVGFNPIERVPLNKRSQTTSAIVSAFKGIWSDSWGPRLEYILVNTVRLLLDAPGATLLHIPLILSQEGYRNRLLRKATDPFIRYFWQTEFAGYSERLKSEAIAPIQNKAGQFAANPMLRSILGQSSTFDTDKLIATNGVLIANLSKQMGADASHLLGALLTTSFFQAAERRASLPEKDRADFTLYVDEFQNFATDTFATILSEARKYRLNLVIANQFLSQIPSARNNKTPLREAVLGNVGVLVVFRVGYEDAEILAPELGIETIATLTDTPNFEAWVKLVRENVPSEALPTKTERSVPDAAGRLAKIVAHTRARYARPKAAVEANVKAWYS